MHFVEVLTDPTLPRFASDVRGVGTSEENRAAMATSIGFFGSFKFKVFSVEVAALHRLNHSALQEHFLQIAGNTDSWRLPKIPALVATLQ